MIRRLLIPLAVVVVALLGGTVFFAWPAMNRESSSETEVRAERFDTGPQTPGQSERPAQANANAQDREEIPPPGPDTVEGCVQRATMASPAPGSGATTLLVYDHAISAPITMDLRTFCEETIALSPAPDGDLVANFTVYGGHVRADYYLVDRTAMQRLNGHLVPISLPAQVKIPDEEAQAILAEQTRQGRR